MELWAGVTVALVSIPQCMAFAAIAGLDPATGIAAAIVMGVVGAALSATPSLILGPAVTTCTMIFGVLITVAPNDRASWPALAGLLAVLAGGITIVAAVVRFGTFVRFVSRSVLVGFITGAATMIVVSQLDPLLGLSASSGSTLLERLIDTVSRLGAAHPPSIMLAVGTVLVIAVSTRLSPGVPGPFIAIVLSGLVVHLLESNGAGLELDPIGALPSAMPLSITSVYRGAFTSDLFVGALAIALVGMIQTLAISRSFATRTRATMNARRELVALGCANMLSGVLGGFPGAASFSRSALCDAAGARTRIAGFVAAGGLLAIVALAAPLTHFITAPAIAGLLMATAWALVDRRELMDILRRGGADRIVLVTTVLAVWVIPLHWAILIGLSLSMVLFLRRVSELHVVEMVNSGEDQFSERPIDAQTGRSAIVMLQVEGPLFFAHADELAKRLRSVFEQSPRAVVLRMRRTQQIDFSVIAALAHESEAYCDGGGTVIVCGLTPEMHRTLVESALGRIIGTDHFMPTTKKVFGSAHRAIDLARSVVATAPAADRALFRGV